MHPGRERPIAKGLAVTLLRPREDMGLAAEPFKAPHSGLGHLLEIL